jgi:hypothetical protein
MPNDSESGNPTNKMEITTKRHLAALCEVGELYPRSLMKAMQCAMNHLGSDRESESADGVMFREINLVFWTYINLCLGLEAQNLPPTEKEAHERWSAVWDKACQLQDGGGDDLPPLS